MYPALKKTAMTVQKQLEKIQGGISHIYGHQSMTQTFGHARSVGQCSGFTVEPFRHWDGTSTRGSAPPCTCCQSPASHAGQQPIIGGHLNTQSHSVLCLCHGLLVLLMSCRSVQSCISSWSSRRAQSRRETNQVTHKGTAGRSHAAGMQQAGDEKDVQPSS